MCDRLKMMRYTIALSLSQVCACVCGGWQVALCDNRVALYIRISAIFLKRKCRFR